MIQEISHIAEHIVFIYGCTLLCIYTLLAYMALQGVRKFKRRNDYVDYDKVLGSELLPGISVVAPAFNEGLSIISNVRSLLTLNYPKFEVVIVNDGSTDNTLEQLIVEFQLQEVDFAYDEQIVTQPVKRIFKSRKAVYSNLIVVDKVNGKSKADASNAGINASSYNYFLCTDVDCLLDRNTLIQLIKPFLEEEEKKIKEVGEPCPECGYVHVIEDNIRVIASGATLRLGNSCEVEEGVITRMRAPRQLLPRFQEMEYIRAYVLGKMGWSAINAVPNVSGGLGLFDREIAVKAGGYDAKSFAEDMDIITRMCAYMIENKIKYAIRYIPVTLCWTEGPATLKVFGRQRTRWGRGLAEIMSIHGRLIFRPKYRKLGMIVMPYNLFFEFLAPIIETLGVFYYIYLILSGSVNWPYAVLLLVFAYLFSVMISSLAVLWDQITFRYYKTWTEVVGLCLMAFLEPLIYHPLIVFFALKGYFNFATGKKHSWGNMQRQGFGKKKPAMAVTK